MYIPIYTIFVITMKMVSCKHARKGNEKFSLDRHNHEKRGEEVDIHEGRQCNNE